MAYTFWSGRGRHTRIVKTRIVHSRLWLFKICWSVSVLQLHSSRCQWKLSCHCQPVKIFLLGLTCTSKVVFSHVYYFQLYHIWLTAEYCKTLNNHSPFYILIKKKNEMFRYIMNHPHSMIIIYHIKNPHQHPGHTSF